MFIINKFKKLLETFGIFQKQATILLLGLDNSGKTTLRHRLLNDKIAQRIDYPRSDSHSDEEYFVLDNMLFKIYECGGLLSVRKKWKDEVQKIQGIVFLVDSADPQRFDESKEDLEHLIKLNQQNNNVICQPYVKVPILILGNKIDRPQAVTEGELRQVFGITENQFISQDQNQTQINVFMCSVVKRIGYIDGLKWLSQFCV